MRPSPSPRQRRNMRAAPALAGALLLALPAVALSQARPIIRLTPRAGEIGVEMRAERRGYTNGPPAQDVAYREWVRLPLSGTLLSRQFFDYDFVLRPMWGQQESSGLDRGFATRATGVDFNASMLQTAYSSLVAFLTRASGSAEGGFGGESFFTSRARGLSARIRTLYLPIAVEASERTTDDTWQASIASTPLRRLEKLSTTRLTTQSSKTTLTYEKQRFNDRIGTLSFVSSGLTAAHRAHWGRASALETAVERSNRTGSDPFSRVAWSERLTLRHSSAVNSNWHYQSRRSSNLGIASTGYSAAGGLRYDATRWLTASVQSARLTTRYARGRSAAWSVTPRITLRHEIVRGVQLSGGLGIGYDRVRREITDGEWADVTEERHRVEPARVFSLERLYPDLSSAVVRSADLTTTYQAETDYRLVAFGPLVRLQLVPGSRIAVGDILVVSYRYRMLVKTPHRVTRTTLEGAFTAPHVTVTHTQNWRQLSLLSGPTASVPSEGDDRASVLSVYGTLGSGRANLDLEERARSGSPSDFETQELRVTLAPAATGRWHMSLGGAAGRTEAAARTMQVLSANTSLGVSPAAALRLLATVDAWTIRLPDAARELFLGASVEADWRIGNIETEWRYWHQSRSAELTGVQRRLWLRIVRRF